MMKPGLKSKLTLTVRVLLGLLFVVSGMFGLLNLVPAPENLPENMKAFDAGLTASMYFKPLLKATEVVCGLFLLSGFFVPLALVVLAPIVLNIFFVHLFLAPQGLPIAIVMGVFLAYLAFFAAPYARVVRQLFRPK
jgi:putative oxidoreductase